MILSVLFLLLCATIATSQPPIPTPAEEAKPVESKTNTEQQVTPQEIPPTQPPASTIQLQKSPEAARISQESSNNTGQKTAPDWVARFTGALVVVGFLQVIAIGIQACYMRHGLQLTRQAAKAATQNANTATQALHTLERAYLTPNMTNWEMRGVIREDYSNGFIAFPVTNVGRTKATIITIEIQSSIDHPSQAERELIALSPEPFQATLFANQALVCTFPMKDSLPSKDSREDQEFRAGSRPLWYHVRIRYQDVFKRRHCIDLSAKYAAISQQFTPQDIAEHDESNDRAE